MNKKGFSLIEVIIVTVIVGILISVGIGSVSRYEEKEDIAVVDVQEVRAYNPLKLIATTSQYNSTTDKDIYVYELTLENGTQCIIAKEWNDAIGITCNWKAGQ